jgi:CRISPR-associated protein Cmr5
MNILRSLEQKRSNFAYNLLNEVVNLRSKDNLERLNELLKIIYKKDVSLTSDEFEALKTDKKGEKKDLLDDKFQKTLEEKLSSYISRSPTMILVNGLGNTMAFYISKIGVEPNSIPKLIINFKTALQEFKEKAPEIQSKINELKKSKEENDPELKKLEKEYKTLEYNLNNTKKKLLEILKPDKIAYLIIYTAINDWLKSNEIGIIKDAKDILEWFRKNDTSSLDVLHATKETIELLKWMKRFAEAMLEEGDRS